MRRVALAALAVVLPWSPVWSESTTPNPLFVPQFAGDALAVALAFSLPALLAGGFLAGQRLHAKLGTRTLFAAATAIMVGLGIALMAPGQGWLIEWAGITVTSEAPLHQPSGQRVGR